MHILKKIKKVIKQTFLSKKYVHKYALSNVKMAICKIIINRTQLWRTGMRPSYALGKQFLTMFKEQSLCTPGCQLVEIFKKHFL